MSVQIELVAAKSLEGKSSAEKVSLVLGAVKKDKIVVLETPLSHQEEKMLIEKTMQQVSDKFSGIEISTFGEQNDDLKSRLVKMLGGKTYGFTVIGPSHLVKQIKRDPDKLNLFAGK